jgi:hypothetical protein
MREVTTCQEFNEWRRTAKPGERLLYHCNRPTFSRDIAIENAILDAKDVKVSGLHLVVLTKKHLRGRGKGGGPQRQAPYAHTASASSIGRKKSWRDPPPLSDKKSGELFETFRQKIEGQGPMTTSRADRAVWDHVTAWARDR